MKLNVLEILLKSVAFLKTNYTKLLPFVLFMFLYNMVSIGFVYFGAQKGINPLMTFLLTLVMLLMLVFYVKLILAVQIYANNILIGQEITLSSAYHLTKGKFWLYVRCYLIIALWMIPFAAIAILKIQYTASIVALYIHFIMALFFMLLPLIATQSKSNKYLTRSMKLIKGNYWSVWTILLITSTIFTLLYSLFVSIYEGQTTQILIIGIINAFIGLFSLPFTSIATAITYHQLTNTK